MRSSLLIVVALILTAFLGQGQDAPAANVSWTSSNDGLWQTPSNWSSDPALPGEFDDVLIDQLGSLTVTLSSGLQSVNQLTAQENLVINNAAELTVGSGGGTINGALAIPSGRLAIEAGGVLTVNGAVSANVTGLRALSGGTLNLPTLATINAPSSPVATYDAQGALSKLDLSTVTTFNGANSTSPTTVSAFNGGRVELENVSAITAGATFVVADGTNSVIDLTALTHFTADNQFSGGRLHALNGATMLTPNLATLGRATVEVRGATSSLNLQALTSADGASFTARAGGHIAPPLLTSYAAGLGLTEFFANGSGSLIDLSNVTAFSGATFNSMVISANDSAKIELSGVASISSGAVNLSVGSGGVVDLSSLQSYTATNLPQVRRFRADNGGTIRLRDDGKTTISNASVESVGTGVITGQELELGVGASLAINGTLDADLTNTAGVIAVGGAPGTTTVDGDFIQAGSGTTQVQIGGLTPSTQFDRLVVNGAAQLGGTIHISLTGGFTPSAGNSFEVLTAAGGISGTFNVTWSGAIPWDAQYDGDSVTLVPGFDADFNQDLSVDGDDLAEWKTGFGTLTGAENADGDADGDADVDGADFLQWQREVGANVPQSVITAVPEPTTLLLACLALALTAATSKSRTHGRRHDYK